MFQKDLPQTIYNFSNVSDIKIRIDKIILPNNFKCKIKICRYFSLCKLFEVDKCQLKELFVTMTRRRE